MNKFLSVLFLTLFLMFGYQLRGFCNEEVQSREITPEVRVNPAELPYDYSSTVRVPIYLSITEQISTKDDLQEGQKLDFRVIKDVVYKDTVILKSGDIVTGTLETIITSGMNGFPAEVIIDNFDIPGIKHSQLISSYNKRGQNRCFWVYPLKWSLTLIPFVGSLTNFIMGGEAKVKTSDVITIYYYPEWK